MHQRASSSKVFVDDDIIISSNGFHSRQVSNSLSELARSVARTTGEEKRDVIASAHVSLSLFLFFFSRAAATRGHVCVCVVVVVACALKKWRFFVPGEGFEFSSIGDLFDAVTYTHHIARVTRAGHAFTTRSGRERYGRWHLFLSQKQPQLLQLPMDSSRNIR